MWREGEKGGAGSEIKGREKRRERKDAQGSQGKVGRVCVVATNGDGKGAVIVEE